MSEDNEPIHIRMFVEEICCELSRFQHLEDDDVLPGETRVSREVNLGATDRFADIYVKPKGRPGYFMEVKIGYSSAGIVERLKSKYGVAADLSYDVARVVLVADREARTDWTEMIDQVRASLRPGMELEVWDEAYLCSLIGQRFGIRVDSVTRADLVD